MTREQILRPNRFGTVAKCLESRVQTEKVNSIEFLREHFAQEISAIESAADQFRDGMKSLEALHGKRTFEYLLNYLNVEPIRLNLHKQDLFDSDFVQNRSVMADRSQFETVDYQFAKKELLTTYAKKVNQLETKLKSLDPYLDTQFTHDSTIQRKNRKFYDYSKRSELNSTFLKYRNLAKQPEYEHQSTYHTFFLDNAKRAISDMILQNRKVSMSQESRPQRQTRAKPQP